MIHHGFHVLSAFPHHQLPVCAGAFSHDTVDVFDLARAFPGTRYVVLSEGDDHKHWPEDVDAGAPWSECFREIDIGMAPTRVFEIVCR